MKNNFEDIIQSTLENHEVPYDASAWSKLEGKLTPAKTPFYKSKWIAGGAIIILVASVATYFGMKTAEEVDNNIVAVDLTNELITGRNSKHHSSYMIRE